VGGDGFDAFLGPLALFCAKSVIGGLGEGGRRQGCQRVLFACSVAKEQEKRHARAGGSLL